VGFLYAATTERFMKYKGRGKQEIGREERIYRPSPTWNSPWMQ